MLTSVFEGLAMLDRYFSKREPLVTAEAAVDALDYVTQIFNAQCQAASAPTLFAESAPSFFDAQAGHEL